MTITIISTIAIVFIFVLIFIIRNLSIQNRKYQQLAEDSQQEFYDILEDVQERISETLALIRELDEKEMFEKDDEVGAVFQKLIEAIDYLDDSVIQTFEAVTESNDDEKTEEN